MAIKALLLEFDYKATKLVIPSIEDYQELIRNIRLAFPYQGAIVPEFWTAAIEQMDAAILGSLRQGLIRHKPGCAKRQSEVLPCTCQDISDKNNVKDGQLREWLNKDETD